MPMRTLMLAAAAIAAVSNPPAGAAEAGAAPAAEAPAATAAAAPDAGAAEARGKESAMQEAMFGAGCFWGVEVTFRNVKGVADAAVGYAGGKTENPTYKQVCTDTTGHAEVVHVKFDPAVVSYEALLRVFFENHDPTQLNRQGPDYGSQYRSVVFAYSPDQKAAAEKMKAELDASGKYGKRSVMTEIADAAPFWPAEEYHQRYLEKRGLATCHVK